MTPEPDLLKTLFRGAVGFSEREAFLFPERFTPSQIESYRENPDFQQKTHACSCVRLELETDAEKIRFAYRIDRGSSRKFYYFSPHIDAQGFPLQGNGSYEVHPEGRFELSLPDGPSHAVTVYFPSLCSVGIRDLVLENASFVRPVKKEKRFLFFGDSITQGYDAKDPAVIWPNRVGDACRAEVFNKAIGGDTFHPEVFGQGEPERADLIFVAYGTNDWKKKSRADFIADAEGFYARLHELYAGIKVFALLPVWRGNASDRFGTGTLAEASEILRSICEKYAEITVIDGIGLIPHDAKLFSPDVLHPNDQGFAFYSENLLKKLALLNQMCRNII